MKKSSYIAFFIFGILFISAFTVEIFQQENSNFTLVTLTKKFTAGSKVKLSFSSKESTTNPLLVLNHSYGTTLVTAKKKDNLWEYTIPSIFSKKTGLINWTLIANNKTILKNTIEIIPNTNTKTLIESYLGPRSIQAGNKDYSMLVVIPTDMFDNPLPKNTTVNIHKQFLENVSINEERTNNLIAWKNIISEKKSGNILVSSLCNATNSNELTTVIYPSNPVNFNINFKRNHSFADGNQVTQFITSTIKDEFGNIVSDGTLVEFFITTANNNILKTRATTINGIAIGKILHPDYATTWKVKSFVSGLAESNTITLTYKPIISDFNVEFTKQNRQIIIGPLQSFMNQLIPDGALVKLNIYHKNILIETKSKTSFKGYVTFNLLADFYKEPSYSFIIDALGISKQIETKNYAKQDK